MEKKGKMEGMIKKSRSFNEAIDYRSQSIFPYVRLPPKFKMSALDKFDEQDVQNPTLRWT